MVYIPVLSAAAERRHAAWFSYAAAAGNFPRREKRREIGNFIAIIKCN